MPGLRITKNDAFNIQTAIIDSLSVNEEIISEEILQVTGTLEVSGTSDFHSLTTHNAGIDVNGDADVSGDVVIGGDLDVTGTAEFVAAPILSTTNATDGYVWTATDGTGVGGWEPVSAAEGVAILADTQTFTGVNTFTQEINLSSGRIDMYNGSTNRIDFGSAEDTAEYSIIHTVGGNLTITDSNSRGMTLDDTGVASFSQNAQVQGVFSVLEADDTVDNQVVLGSSGTGLQHGSSITMYADAANGDGYENTINFHGDITRQFYIKNDPDVNTNGSFTILTNGDKGLTMDDGGNVTLTDALTVQGNFTVNGSTTIIESTTLEVADKNIEMGVSDSADNNTASGGGIILDGGAVDGDKTILWALRDAGDDATGTWTSSEDWNLASGKAYYINNTEVLNSTTLTLGGSTFAENVSVAGTLGVTGAATFTGDIVQDAGNGNPGEIRIETEGTTTGTLNFYDVSAVTDAFYVRHTQDSVDPSLSTLAIVENGGEGMTLDASGNATFSQNVTVTGTVTLTDDLTLGSATKAADYILTKIADTSQPANFIEMYASDGTDPATNSDFYVTYNPTDDVLAWDISDGGADPSTSYQQNGFYLQASDGRLVKVGDSSPNLLELLSLNNSVNRLDFSSNASGREYTLRHSSGGNLQFMTNGGEGLVMNPDGEVTLTDDLTLGSSSRNADYTVTKIANVTGAGYDFIEAYCDNVFAATTDFYHIYDPASRVLSWDVADGTSPATSFQTRGFYLDSDGDLFKVDNTGENNIVIDALTGATASQLVFRDNGTPEFKLYHTLTSDIRLGPDASGGLTIDTTGAATFSSTLDVTGAATFTGDIVQDAGSGNPGEIRIETEGTTTGTLNFYDVSAASDAFYVRHSQNSGDPSLSTLTIVENGGEGMTLDASGNATFSQTVVVDSPSAGTAQLDLGRSTLQVIGEGSLLNFYATSVSNESEITFNRLTNEIFTITHTNNLSELVFATGADASTASTTMLSFNDDATVDIAADTTFSGVTTVAATTGASTLNVGPSGDESDAEINITANATSGDGYLRFYKDNTLGSDFYLDGASTTVQWRTTDATVVAQANYNTNSFQIGSENNTTTIFGTTTVREPCTFGLGASSTEDTVVTLAGKSTATSYNNILAFSGNGTDQWQIYNDTLAGTLSITEQTDGGGLSFDVNGNATFSQNVTVTGTSTFSQDTTFDGSNSGANYIVYKNCDTAQHFAEIYTENGTNKFMISYDEAAERLSMDAWQSSVASTANTAGMYINSDGNMVKTNSGGRSNVMSFDHLSGTGNINRIAFRDNTTAEYAITHTVDGDLTILTGNGNGDGLTMDPDGICTFSNDVRIVDAGSNTELDIGDRDGGGTSQDSLLNMFANGTTYNNAILFYSDTTAQFGIVNDTSDNTLALRTGADASSPTTDCVVINTDATVEIPVDIVEGITINNGAVYTGDGLFPAITMNSESYSNAALEVVWSKALGYYVTVTGGDDPDYAYSTDGVTWTNANTAITDGFFRVREAGDTIAIMGDRLAFYYTQSSDPATAYSVKVIQTSEPQGGTNADILTGFTYASSTSQWVVSVACTGKGGRLYFSSDLSGGWGRASETVGDNNGIPDGEAIADVAYSLANDVVIVLGASESIAYGEVNDFNSDATVNSGPGYTNWHMLAINTAGDIAIAVATQSATDGMLRATGNLQSWDPVTWTDTAYSISSVRWFDDLNAFILVCDDGTDSYAFLSYTGETWKNITAVTDASTSIVMNDVAYSQENEQLTFAYNSGSNAIRNGAVGRVTITNPILNNTTIAGDATFTQDVTVTGTSTFLQDVTFGTSDYGANFVVNKYADNASEVKYVERFIDTTVKFYAIFDAAEDTLSFDTKVNDANDSARKKGFYLDTGGTFYKTDVTGINTITMNVLSGANDNRITFQTNGTPEYQIYHTSGGTFDIETDGGDGLSLDSSGNATFTQDVSVTGDLDSTTLTAQYKSPSAYSVDTAGSDGQIVDCEDAVTGTVTVTRPSNTTASFTVQTTAIVSNNDLVFLTMQDSNISNDVSINVSNVDSTTTPPEFTIQVSTTTTGSYGLTIAFMVVQQPTPASGNSWVNP